MRRRRLPFATRLFLALFLLSAIPSLALLGVATWGLRNYVELAGAGGAWQGVGETGRALFDALEGAGVDSTVSAAAETHENELSRSVRLGRRWDLIAGRLANALPWFALVLGLSLGAVAAWAARQFARGLSRPVGEVVDWAGRLAREESLPLPGPGESRGSPEFSVLRDAFRQMAHRLAEGRRQALEAERLRALTEMGRRVAHEIKNPLTPMVLAVRQARHFITRGKLEALEEPLGIIEHEAGRLDEMARSFAQLGRLPEGPASEIDLEEMLTALLRSDLPASIEGRLHVPERLPRLLGHLDALNRVFRNLLGNAVEALADRADGRIEVTVAERNGMVEVAIADNGPGVPAEARRRLWDPDYTTKKKGTGLGLALVRQIIQAHDGVVEVVDCDAGACFVVRLPVTATAE